MFVFTYSTCIYLLEYRVELVWTGACPRIMRSRIMSTSWTFTVWPWLYFNRVLNKVLFMYERWAKIRGFNQCFESVFIWSGSRSSNLGWIPIQIQGFDDKKLEKITAEQKCNIYFFSKIAICLFLGLHKGRPMYRRSLRPSKENIHFCGSFLPFWIWIRVPNPDLDWPTDLIWIRIGIRNTGFNAFLRGLIAYIINFILFYVHTVGMGVAWLTYATMTNSLKIS